MSLPKLEDQNINFLGYTKRSVKKREKYIRERIQRISNLFFEQDSPSYQCDGELYEGLCQLIKDLEEK